MQNANFACTFALIMRLWLKIFNDAVVMSVRELWGNKLRAFLSLLGVTIGIFCVIAIFTAVDSFQKYLEGGIKKMGTDIVYVSRWPWEFGNKDYPWWKYIARPTQSYDDYKMLKDRLENAEGTALTCDISGKKASYEGITADNLDINCVTHDYFKIQELNFTSGRYFTEDESAAGMPVCILGSNIDTTLFGTSPAIGKEIKLFGRHVRVIGIFEQEGSSPTGNSNDDKIMVPYNFIKTIENVKWYEPQIVIKAKAGVALDALEEEVKSVMRSIRMLSPTREDNFSINRITMLTNALDQMFGAVTFGGLIIGVFSLLIGAFGIANIMFVSVRERTNLIGIKKALGAKQGVILLEFLVEAIILCILGGLLGLLLVQTGAWIFGAILHFSFVISTTAIVIALSIASATGILAGLIPAYLASRLDPVEAIRSK